MPEQIARWTPRLPGDLAGIVADAERAVASLGQVQTPALAALARLLLRTEAIASSKIEGMQIGARELARAEARHDLGVSVGTEARSILAGIDAMQFAIDEASSGEVGVTKQHLLDVHSTLMAGEAAWTTPGRYRTVQNWIGGNDYNPCRAAFVPPPPDEVHALLDDLVAACASEALPAVVQCAIVHAQFETIHPFNDGNGRVGRALLHVVLRRRGLVRSFVPPVSVVLSNRRERYVDALTRFRAGEVEQLIELFAISLGRSVVLAQRYLAEVEELRTRWRSAVLSSVATPRADAAIWLLLDRLPAHPVLTGPAAVGSTGRSKPAVNQAIAQLVTAGVLEPLSISARNRSWEPVGLLELVERLEASA